jgi:hypothetical protein
LSICEERVKVQPTSVEQEGDRPLHTYIGLGRRKLELNDRNLGLLHPRRSTSARDDRLGEGEAIDELRVVDGAADLLD